LDSIWNSGIAIIIALQGLGDWLTLPMRVLTVLGLPGFYVLLIPVGAWCLDARLWLRLSVYLFASIWLNEVLKVGLHQPRPFWLSQQVQVMGPDGSFGFPSGHAQHAVVMWGLLAAASHRPWAWPAAALAAFLIGLSRVYLGVHFPSDVVGGWLIGLLCLWTFLKWESRVRVWFGGLALTAQLAGAFMVSIGMLGFGILVTLSPAGWQMPGVWQTNAQAVVGAGFDPAGLEFAVMAAGIPLGAIMGACLMSRTGGFQADGSPLQRFVRLPLGLAVAGVIWVLVGWLTPELGHPWQYGPLYVRAALTGLWIFAGAPLLFVRLHLAQTAPGHPVPSGGIVV
jgi:membrane-associated phospholipid phosphatase